MYQSLKVDGKQYWTHLSLVDEANQAKIKELYDQIPRWKNTFTFFTFYGMLEAVNRIKPLKAQNIYLRFALVLAPTFVARWAATPMFWQSNDAILKKNLDGAPLWSKKWDVPELDKMFFFLDDDKNFEPNLWHHGLTNSKKFERIYKHE